MADVKFTGHLVIPLEYTYGALAYNGEKGDVAGYVNSGEKTYIKVDGAITFDSDDAVAGGTVNRISFYQQDDFLCARMTKFSFDATQVDAMLKSGDFPGFVAAMLSGSDTLTGSNYDDKLLAGYDGDDRITGKGGVDQIDGGGGNDRLTGGKGSDVFVFGNLYGNDVITDFDAKGGVLKQDYIDTDFNSIDSIEKAGRNTVVSFISGDQLTLLHVKPGDVTPDDFL